MKKFILGITLLTAMAFSRLPFQTYVWEHYGLEITVPDDFKVIKNTDNEFEMKGVGMGLYMYVYEQDKSLDEMDEAVIAVAKSLKMDEVEEATEIEGGGLEGFFVEGVKSGKRVVLAGMIDPKSHSNFMMLITLYDGDHVAVEDAVDIINSVHSTK